MRWVLYPALFLLGMTAGAEVQRRRLERDLGRRVHEAEKLGREGLARCDRVAADCDRMYFLYCSAGTD